MAYKLITISAGDHGNSVTIATFETKEAADMAFEFMDRFASLKMILIGDGAGVGYRRLSNVHPLT